MKIVVISFIVIVLFFAVFSTRADTVVLQNGRTLQCEIIGQTDDYVEIRLGFGRMKLNRADIKSFEIREPAEGYSKADLSETEKAEQKEEVTAKKAEGVSKINLKAEYLKGKIAVVGRSGLPQGTAVTVYFKRHDDIIAVRKAVTGDGDFYATFGPFGKGLLAGEYIIEARAEPKGKEAAYGSRSLLIGTAAQVSINENEERRSLAETAAEIQALYEELNKTYEKNKENFDKNKWDRWSAGWLRKADAQLRGYSRTDTVSLYPRARRILESSMHHLILLYAAYSSDLTGAGQKDNGKESAKPSPPVFGPQFLKDSIIKELAAAKEEISLPPAK